MSDETPPWELRLAESTRVEGFSDAVFAIAITQWYHHLCT
jgi:hypothetical protein